MKFKVLTKDRYQFVRDLLGWTLQAGGAIIRDYPFAYPPSPNMLCRSVDSIEQIGLGYALVPSGFPWIGRQWSIVTARFVPAYYFPTGAPDPSGQPYTTTTLNITSESYTIPGTVYKFPAFGGNSAPLANGVRHFPEMQIQMKRWMLPFEPVAAIANLIGKVNVADFVVGDFVCPVGTVLFVGAPVEITFDTLGNITYTAEYIFVYRTIPWNAFLSPEPGQGWAIPLDNSGNPVLDSGDFSTLP